MNPANAPVLPAVEAAPANRATPIFMAHGYGHTVIPYEFAERSAALLCTQGYALDWRPYETEHTVCLEELRDLEAWLARVLRDA